MLGFHLDESGCIKEFLESLKNPDPVYRFIVLAIVYPTLLVVAFCYGASYLFLIFLALFGVAVILVVFVMSLRGPAVKRNPYTATATSKSPAVVIYLLDASQSMEELIPSADGVPKIQRIEAARKNVTEALKLMVARSTYEENTILPRYEVALASYSDGENVNQLTNGLVKIDSLQKKIPRGS